MATRESFSHIQNIISSPDWLTTIMDDLYVELQTLPLNLDGFTYSYHANGIRIGIRYEDVPARSGTSKWWCSFFAACIKINKESGTIIFNWDDLCTTQLASVVLPLENKSADLHSFVKKTIHTVIGEQVSAYIKKTQNL